VRSQTWNNREVKVWIKAETPGKAAYKQINIKFSGNSAPVMRGNVGPWDIVVNEVDDNSGQTQEFNVEFDDPDGDRIVDYKISAGFYQQKFAKVEAIGSPDNFQGLRFVVDKSKVTSADNGPKTLNIKIKDEFGDKL
jgi:hypothetical protein